MNNQLHQKTENQKTEDLLQLYKFMVASREVDIIESELVNSGEANFLASSKGHEGCAIFAPFLIKSDYLHCHYRDKALMLARGISPTMFFYSALAKAESHSSGRQMVSHMSAPELNITSIVAAVGSNALQATGVASAIKNNPDNPIVICLIGDGTTQQGEVLEAIAEATRSNLPLLFVVHDNHYAISTKTTGKTFFSLPNDSHPQSFYGVPIHHIDGVNIFDSYNTIEHIIDNMRFNKSPQIIILNVDRLDNHSNADDQKLYRSDEEILNSKNNDPLVFAYNYLSQIGVSLDKIHQAKEEAILEVRNAIHTARSGSIPQICIDAINPLPDYQSLNITEYRGTKNNTTSQIDPEKRYTMLEAMRETFNYHLKTNPEVYLFGEDIEDKKGDVFGVTKGLSTKYPNQVKNSPLSESTIIGMSIGMALTKKIPVAFIQFADFLAPAFNQIYTELATMYWRTNGGWNTPVIIFAACGGYRPGLGPFHSQTNEATYAHIPGIDVFMPSNAADAAGLLNAAFHSHRPSLFLYPKKLLNNSGITDTTSRDIERHIVPIGVGRIIAHGQDITMVAWGNTVSLCIEVANTLEEHDISCEIIDLRTIKPFDKKLILQSTAKTKHLLVVHEDNMMCGVGSEILAFVMENSKIPIKAKRIARPDTYTPCNFINQMEILPSYETILEGACQILGYDIQWNIDNNLDDTLYYVNVIGASPSDESILITHIYVKVGDVVNTQDRLVDIEASKASGEILSPTSGVVHEIMVTQDEKALVGSILLTLKIDRNTQNQIKNITKTPIIKKQINNYTSPMSHANKNNIHKVGINIPLFQTGSRLVKNDELLKQFPGFNNDDIVQRTGIYQRYWLDDNENILDIAANVTHRTLEKYQLQLADIDMIICATCTQDVYKSPSMACLILNKLYKIYGEHSLIAYDINAACSGYLYALQNATDYLKTRPDKRVLLITAEYLSNHINIKDFDTAFLFGDGVTATIISGENYLDSTFATVDNIYLSGIGESGDILNISCDKSVGIKLSGKKLFTFAVKSMANATKKCCEQHGVTLSDIDVVIPHQANQRIIDAIEHRLKIKSGSMYSNVAKYGNTSSCSIPIAMNESLDNCTSGNTILLAAFGGGFTFGSVILTCR